MSAKRRTRDGKAYRLSGREDGPWYADAYDQLRRRWMRRSTRVTHQRPANRIASRWLEEGEAMAAGASSQPAGSRVDVGVAENGTPLSPILAALAKFIDAKRRSESAPSPRHLQETRRRLERVILAVKWEHVADIEREKLLEGIEQVATESEATFSARTKNAYRAAWRSFTSWLVDTDRAPLDPLRRLAKWRVDGTETFRRLAYTRADVAKLIAHTTRSAPAFDLPGSDRAMLYLVALATGFRVSELASLTPSSFDLAAQTPTVTLRGRNAKNNRDVEQPLVPRGLPEMRVVVERLRVWLRDRDRHTPCWRMADWAYAATMLRLDLAAAGVDLPRGVYDRADFHSLRGTLGTWLARAGVSTQFAQRILRHSDPALTAKYYTRLGAEEMASGLDQIVQTPLLEEQSLMTEEPTMAARGEECRGDQPAPESAHEDGSVSSERCAISAQPDNARRVPIRPDTTSEGFDRGAAPGSDDGARGSLASPDESRQVPMSPDTTNAPSRTRTLNPLIKSARPTDSNSVAQQVLAHDDGASAAHIVRSAATDAEDRREPPFLPDDEVDLAEALGLAEAELGRLIETDLDAVTRSPAGVRQAAVTRSARGGEA